MDLVCKLGAGKEIGTVFLRLSQNGISFPHPHWLTLWCILEYFLQEFWKDLSLLEPGMTLRYQRDFCPESMHNNGLLEDRLWLKSNRGIFGIFSLGPSTSDRPLPRSSDKHVVLSFHHSSLWFYMDDAVLWSPWCCCGHLGTRGSTSALQYSWGR